MACRYVSRHSLNWEQNATPLLEKASERPWTASATRIVDRGALSSFRTTVVTMLTTISTNISQIVVTFRSISLHSVANGLFLIEFILKRSRNVLGRPRQLDVNHSSRISHLAHNHHKNLSNRLCERDICCICRNCTLSPSSDMPKQADSAKDAVRPGFVAMRPTHAMPDTLIFYCPTCDPFVCTFVKKCATSLPLH